MAEPYTYTDHDGDHLEIRVRPEVTHLVAVDTDGGRTAVFVRAEDRADVAAALWPDGQAPIIVENPDVYELGACNLPSGRRVDWDDETGLINLRGSHAVHQYSPDEAIEAGSWLIALGKAAKTGPSRAEVERLAAFLDGSMDATPEGLARAFLARFEVKERAL